MFLVFLALAEEAAGLRIASRIKSGAALCTTKK